MADFTDPGPVPLQLIPDSGVLPATWLGWLVAAADRVPFPTAVVPVHNASCPTESAEPSCVDWDGSAAQLYFDQGAVAAEERRETLLHECAHLYDRYAMSEEARVVWLRTMKERRPWRFDGPNSPHEQFAESYSIIARGLTFRRAVRRESFGGYDFTPTSRQFRRLALMLKRLAD